MIADGEVQVWRLDLMRLAPLAPLLHNLLDDAELARLARLVIPADRMRFVLLRGAVRVVLGRELALPPRVVPLVLGRNGKPRLAGNRDARMPWFNVSHAGAAGLVAVSLTRPVGVDVERVRTGSDPLRLARRFFNSADMALLTASVPDAQEELLLRLLTRKEACVKAAGGRLLAGLRLDVDGNSADHAVAGLRGHPELSGPWRVREVAIDPPYVAAVARDGTENFSLTCNDFVINSAA